MSMHFPRDQVGEGMSCQWNSDYGCYCYCNMVEDSPLKADCSTANSTPVASQMCDFDLVRDKNVSEPQFMQLKTGDNRGTFLMCTKVCIIHLSTWNTQYTLNKCQLLLLIVQKCVCYINLPIVYLTYFFNAAFRYIL